MSGDSASLAIDIGTTTYAGLQAAEQASAAHDIAAAQAEAQAQQVLGAGAAQAATLEGQAAVAEFRASQFAQQAKLTRARTALRKAQEAREGRRRQGTRRAAFAGRGITRRGSPTEVLADAAAEEALNLAILEFEGESRAQISEQAADLRRGEASIFRHQAGLVRSIATKRASFIRDNATSGLPSPLAAGLAAGVGTLVQTRIPERIGSMIADGPDTFSPGVDLVPRDQGVEPRRRSQIGTISLP